MATKAVKNAVQTVAETAAQATKEFSSGPHFPQGQKQVFLPNYVITFIRPRNNLSPNMATFKVPLEFNKLDLRDYLWNVYGERVLGVRSFVNQQAPQRKGARGAWYRPRATKMMIAELARPFVWPAPLPAEARDADFDLPVWQKLEDERARSIQMQEHRATGVIPLRKDVGPSAERTALAEQAKEFLSGRKVWKNNTQLDEIWESVEAQRGASAPVKK